MQRPMPVVAHAYGDIDSMNAPTYLSFCQIDCKLLLSCSRCPYVESLALALEEHIYASVSFSYFSLLQLLGAVHSPMTVRALVAP